MWGFGEWRLEFMFQMLLEDVEFGVEGVGFMLAEVLSPMQHSCPATSLRLNPKP